MIVKLRFLWCLVVFGFLVVADLRGQAQSDSWQDPALSEASWIWNPDGGVLCHLRKTFIISGEISEADLLVTADNGYELYVNGSFIGSDIGAASEVWKSVERYNLKALLRPGTNVVAIRASDLGGQAGFLGVIRWVEKGSAPKVIVSDGDWLVTPSSDPTGFTEINFLQDASWRKPLVIGKNGCAPWGKVTADGPRSPNLLSTEPGQGIKEPGEDFSFPETILFLRGRVVESSTPDSPQAVWRIGNSRAYLELDTLGPSMPGKSLNVLTRNSSGPEKYKEQVLFDGKGGLVGSASISHDGKTVFFSHVPRGDKFWRVYRMPLSGGTPVALTTGAFHDFDPEPLPDGRIVFSSTRIGNREEYHGNLARSIHVMNADGSDIRAITHHIVGDMEPKLTADGNIVFVRQDNFLERAKVETHIHSIHPDGTAGQVLLGPDRKALGYGAEHGAEENGLWLRNYGFGSPAPLPDGRVAALSSFGVVISGNAVQPQKILRPAVELVDIAPLPDGRLLCTIAGQSGVGIFDLEKNEISRIYSRVPFDLHSAVYAGSRPAPSIARSSVPPELENVSRPTGFLLGQSVFVSKQQNVDLTRIKAVRVIEGRPFALRSARHPYAHLGVEAIDLGTAPVAADGSFYIEVPADRALSIQAVDGEGRSVVNELSWIYVRPGEQRSCVGCHSQREAAPPNSGGILALRSEPVKLLGGGESHRWRGNNAANGGVLNLQVERMREGSSINSLTPPAGKQVAHRRELIDAWLEKLANGSQSEKISAAQRLAVLRDRKASSALVLALNSDSSEVRLSAAIALGGCGTADSVQRLVAALNDPSPAVRQAAHVALRSITAAPFEFNAHAPAAGIEQWQKFLADKDWASLQEKKLLEKLRAGTSTEEEVHALGQIGGKASVPELLRLVEGAQPKDLRTFLVAIRALGQLGEEPAVPGLLSLLEKESRKLAKAPPGDHEFGWTQRPVQVAAAAAEALGRIGGRQAEEGLLRAFNQLAEFWYYTFATADHDWLMGCHSSLVHYRILEALDAIGSEKTASILPAMIRSVPIDPDRGLLFENDAYEVVVMRLVARSGLKDDIIAACSEVLSGQTNSLSDLGKVVTDSPPAVSVGPLCVESRAAQILSIVANSSKDSEAARNAFDRYRSLPPSRTRSWTAFYLARALGKIGDSSAAQSLVGALQADAPEADSGLLDPPNVFVYEAMTPFYRAAAADALGRLKGYNGAEVLLKESGHFHNALDVRHAAAGALGQMLTPELLPQARKLAAEHPEGSTRKLLLQACEDAGNGKDRKLAQTP